MAAAFQIPGFSFTREAGQDLSASQFRAVTVAADGQVDPTGAGLRADAVLQDKPASAGEAASLMATGVTKMEFGAATAAGLQVAADANGKAVAAGAADFVIGTALVGAGADGEIGSVLLTLGAQLNP